MDILSGSATQNNHHHNSLAHQKNQNFADFQTSSVETADMEVNSSKFISDFQNQLETLTNNFPLTNNGNADALLAERCAVCGDQSNGIHFGVVVCRACAAFFRRSTINGRVYRCRYDGNCMINQIEVRCSCRACRFNKCVELGMDPTVVQRYRDQIGPRSRPITSASEAYSEEKPVKKRRGPIPGKSGKNKNTMALSALNYSSKSENEQLGQSPPMQTISQQQVATTTTSLTTHFEDGRSYTLLSNSSTTTIAASSPEDILAKAMRQAEHPVSSSPWTQSSSFENYSPASVASANTATSACNNFSPTPNSAFRPTTSTFNQPYNTAFQTEAYLNDQSTTAFFASTPAFNGMGNWNGQNIKPTDFLSLMPMSVAPQSNSGITNQTTNTPLVREMVRGYRNFLHIKRMADSLNLEGNLKKMFTHSTDKMRECSYYEHIATLKTEISLASEMLNDHFPPLKQIFSTESKWTMLRSFFTPFIITERSHLSLKVFPDEKQNHKILISERLYFDLNKLDEFFNVKECKTDPKEIAKVFLPSFQRILTFVRDPLSELKLSEEELMAFAGILFWNERVEGLSEEERRACVQTKEKLYGELYQLCQANAEIDAGTRFASICNLTHTCYKLSDEIARNFSLIKVSNMLEVDSFLHNLSPQSF